MKTSLLLLLFFVLLLPLAASAPDAYKPYLHKPVVPEAPAVRLFGQYNTLLFPGAATYSYPIDVPAGTHGLQPSIVVSYNSQAATQRPGMLGAGWSINQNYLYRDANATPTNTTDDKYVLVFENSVYELIYNPQDALWHTEVDYHFKIEQVSTQTNTYGTYWIVTTTDGTTYRFGSTADAEVVSNTNRSYAVRWNQDQVRDTYQNTITYSYNKDPHTGDAGTSYLTRIAYNNDEQREVLFAYETTMRPDTRRVFDQGNNLSETRRLARISVYANDELVRTYTLNYTTLATSLSALASIARYGADATTLLHTVSFSYYAPTPGDTNTTWSVPVAFTNSSNTDLGVRLVDVNNDGYADLVQGRPGAQRVWHNNKTAWVLANSSLPVIIAGAQGNDSGVRFADANNDGLTDILVGNTSRTVYLNNGTGWTLSNWSLPLEFVDATGTDQGVQLADINGDGTTDLVRAKAGLTNAVFLNNGTGWTNQSAAWPIPATFTSTKDLGVRLLDINADGLPDIVQSNATKAVWLNNGDGWTAVNWSVPVDFTNTTYADTGVRYYDIDGDGLLDLVQALKNTTTLIVNTWLNNGTGWTLNNTWQAPDYFVLNGSNLDRRLADLNGDGMADLVVGNTSVWIKNATTPYLLAAITNEYGGTTTINYTRSTAYNNTGGDGVSDIGFPVLVVERITKNNTLTGAFGVAGTYNYSYEGGTYAYDKREFRGFATTIEQQPGALLRHAFYQDAPRRGKEHTTTTYGLDGTLFTRTVRDYNVTFHESVYNISLAFVTAEQYDRAATPRVTNTSYVYDWFGNPMVVAEHGDVTITGDERTTRTTYGYNKDDWILNRPSRSTTYDALAQRVRETLFYYDHQGLTGVGTHGALTRKEQWNNDGNNTVLEYEYDEYGNVARTTDAAGSATQYSYDATHTHPATLINALGHTTTYAYDLGTGNLLSVTKNDITTTYTYDTHGRISTEVRPYDSGQLPTKQYEYFLNGTAPSRVQISSRSTADNYAVTNYYYDGFGQLLQVKTDRDDDQQAVKNLYYDAAGRAVGEDHPFLAPTSTAITQPIGAPQTNYTYDALDRVTRVTNPDGTNKTTTFDRSNITDYDENGHYHTYETDALGRIVTVVEHHVDPRLNNATETYTTRYDYDANDNLLQITDHEGNEFHFSYDALSRKTGMQDPDMGAWRYAYDTRGNLLRQQDARGSNITLTYDPLNRVTSKNSTDVNQTFSYDTQYEGTLSGTSANNVTLSYNYDERLRVTTLSTTINDDTFTSSYLYDAQDRMISEAGTQQVEYVYDRAGLVRAIPGYVTDAQYDAFGALVNRTYANDLVATYTYETATHRLAGINIPGVQGLNYTYDSVGNIKSINDVQTGKNTLLTYDGLDRLTSATAGEDRYEYTYDALGRIRSIASNNQSKRFVYAGLAHAPSSVIEGGLGADVYHVNQLGTTKNRTVEFFLRNDQEQSVAGVNVSVDFGDGYTATATDMDVTNPVLFLVEHNYTSGGDYTINVTSTTATGSDREQRAVKFGVRARALSVLLANVSERTIEFDLASDVTETLQNVSWNCTGATSSIPIPLLGTLFDYFRINFTSPGRKTVSCTAAGPDGNETKTLTLTVDGLAVESFDTLSTNVSRRIIGFNAKNDYYPLAANISVVSENQSFSTLATLGTGEDVMVFAEINNTAGDSKAIRVSVTAGNESANHTNMYALKGASIDEYTRVDLSNTSKVLLYAVRNTWHNGTVSWNLSSPSLTNSSMLENNETVFLFLAANFSQGAQTPTMSASSAGYNVSLRDYFNVRPIAVGLLTLRDGVIAISEIRIDNTIGQPQDVTWNLDVGLANLTNTTTVDDSLLVFVQSDHYVGNIYRTIATANSSAYTDSESSVVIA